MDICSCFDLLRCERVQQLGYFFLFFVLLHCRMLPVCRLILTINFLEICFRNSFLPIRRSEKALTKSWYSFREFKSCVGFIVLFFFVIISTFRSFFATCRSHQGLLSSVIITCLSLHIIVVNVVWIPFVIAEPTFVMTICVSKYSCVQTPSSRGCYVSLLLSSKKYSCTQLTHRSLYCVGSKVFLGTNSINKLSGHVWFLAMNTYALVQSTDQSVV